MLTAVVTAAGGTGAWIAQGAAGPGRGGAHAAATHHGAGLSRSTEARVTAQRRAALAALATPAARAARVQTRHAFAGLDVAAAIGVVRRWQPAVLAPLKSLTSLAPGERISGYHGRFAATVAGGSGGRGRLLVSAQPLRSTDAAGRLAPVDLTLARGAAGFAPRNSPTPVRLGRTLAGGFTVSGAAVGLVPLGARGSRTASAVAGRAFYANALTDTDWLAEPRADGLEALAQLRSAASPERLSVRIALPAGATARLDPDGQGAATVVRDGAPLARVGAPKAWDADRRPVAVTTTLDGAVLTYAIAHRGADVKYPIMLDPTLTVHQDWQTDGSVPGLAPYGGAGWYTWSTQGVNVDANSPFQMYPSNWVWGEGLYTYQRLSGTFPGFAYNNAVAEWSYRAPGAAYLTAFQYEAARNDPYSCIYEGIFSDATGSWPAQNYSGTHESTTNYAGAPAGGSPPWLTCANTSTAPITDYRKFCLETSCAANTSHPGARAIFGTMVPGYTDNFTTFLGGFWAWLKDDDTPTTTLTGPAAWTNSTAATVTAAGADPSLGVQSLQIASSTSTGWAGIGTTNGACPSWCNGSLTVAKALGATFAQGVNTVTSTSTDPVAHTSPTASATVKLDTAAPLIGTVTGTLYDNRATAFAGTRAIRVPLTGEGSVATQAMRRSGVKQMRLIIDNGTPNALVADTRSFAQADSFVPDPTGADSILRINASTLTPGTHTVNVDVGDWAGSTRLASSFTITAAADTTAPVLTLDGELYTLRAENLTGDAYDFDVESTDLDPTGYGTGTKDIAIALDGTTVAQTSTPCTYNGGSVCDSDLEWTFLRAGHALGTHTITVTSHDQGNHLRTATFSVVLATAANTDPSASEDPNVSGPGGGGANPSTACDDGTPRPRASRVVSRVNRPGVVRGPETTVRFDDGAYHVARCDALGHFVRAQTVEPVPVAGGGTAMLVTAESHPTVDGGAGVQTTYLDYAPPTDPAAARDWTEHKDKYLDNVIPPTPGA